MDSIQDSEMVAAEEYQESPFSSFFQVNEVEKRISMIKQWKHAAIGSTRQKEMIRERNFIPPLVAMLNDDDENEEVLYEVTILLGSMAKGSQDIVDSLIEAGAIKVLLQALLRGNRPLVEACLRCLRSIFLNATTIPYKDIYQDPNTVPVLLSLANESPINQECVAIVFSRACQTAAHQTVLVQNSAIDAMAPLLFSGMFRVQLCGLAFYASLCDRNRDVSLSVLNFVHLGRPLTEQFLAQLSRGNDLALQLGAARVLTAMCRAGAIESSHNMIALKAMPTLVRGCKADPVLSSILLRIQACETLAYLIEEDLELQRLTSWNNQCLKILSSCLNGADLDQEDAKLVEALHSGALSVVASLASNDEEIRKKVISEIQNLLDHIVRGLNAQEHSMQLVSACTKCLHALSRSVEQLRTTFLDRQLWRRLLNLVQLQDVELAATASAVLCNLALEFSPNKSPLIEAGCVEVLCELASREEPSLRLNGIWGLMNLAFQADEKVKQSIVSALSPEQLLRLLTETPPESPMVLRLLGLLRNLLSQKVVSPRAEKAYIDRLMGNHGASVMQTIIFVLEGDYAMGAKEQALLVLSNIAEGDSAKDFIMSNEDVLRKITNYMVHANSRLQVAATSCIVNLAWKDKPGYVERQAKLRDLGIQPRLQQLYGQSIKNDPQLYDKVKSALQHLT